MENNIKTKEMNGIGLIEVERIEQIVKHGKSQLWDVENNTEFQLADAAITLCMPDLSDPLTLQMQINNPPANWDGQRWEKMLKKTYLERLIIAGALIAAEIDRLNNGGYE